VLPVPLLPEAEWIQPLGPVHRKHAIEMIDLVLEELRTVTFHLDLLPIAFEILIAYPNSICAGDPDEEIREGETIVPDLEVLCSYVDDLGIDQWPGSIHLDIHHSNRSADLRRRNPSATPEPRLPIPEGLSHVIENDSDAGGPSFGDWLAAGAQYRVAEKPDAMDGHMWPPLLGIDFTSPNMWNRYSTG
jgi:hypothetical protein